ncbi:Gfo/Idh/MocA family protein [Arthrobacter sp. MMS18-M83]|uniref:Gfo/Idh/MocA family protein n=1 Tax=Arthrobacter sp. MMS18-M83 TaxID=2996261 RepID=UPI003FA3797F
MNPVLTTRHALSDRKSRSTTIRVGIIGTGFSATFHVEALKRVWGVDVQLAAVAGRNPQRTTEFASRHGIPRAFTNYRDLLGETDIDLVCICVPGASHADIAMATAGAGKHIICEKTSSEEAKRMTPSISSVSMTIHWLRFLAGTARFEVRSASTPPANFPHVVRRSSNRCCGMTS